MKKRFLGLLLLSVISMPFGVKGAFAEHAEKSYKSWANSDEKNWNYTRDC